MGMSFRLITSALACRACGGVGTGEFAAQLCREVSPPPHLQRHRLRVCAQRLCFNSHFNVLHFDFLRKAQCARCRGAAGRATGSPARTRCSLCRAIRLAASSTELAWSVHMRKKHGSSKRSAPGHTRRTHCGQQLRAAWALEDQNPQPRTLAEHGAPPCGKRGGVAGGNFLSVLRLTTHATSAGASAAVMDWGAPLAMPLLWLCSKPAAKPRRSSGTAPAVSVGWQGAKHTFLGHSISFVRPLRCAGCLTMCMKFRRPSRGGNVQAYDTLQLGPRSKPVVAAQSMYLVSRGRMPGRGTGLRVGPHCIDRACVRPTHACGRLAGERMTATPSTPL